MTIENTNRAEHCCRDVSTGGAVSTCKECGQEGKPVNEITLKSLAKKSRLETIKNLEGFYFWCARHARDLDSESLLWRLIAPTISQRQGCPS